MPDKANNELNLYAFTIICFIILRFLFTFNDCKFSKTLMFPYKTSSVTRNFLQNERKSFYNDIVSTSHCQSNVCTELNYFSWTCSKLRSTPKSYLHTYLSRESFIRHLEYWFHHLLLVGCKHKHELIKRAHQNRSTNTPWIVQHWKFSSSTCSTISQQHRPCAGVEFSKKKVVGRHTTVAWLYLCHRDIDFALSTIKKVRSQMFHG